MNIAMPYGAGLRLLHPVSLNNQILLSDGLVKFMLENGTASKTKRGLEIRRGESRLIVEENTVQRHECVEVKEYTIVYAEACGETTQPQEGQSA